MPLIYLSGLCFRLDWLHQGSRELFGTIVEDQVYILIDASNSMENHMGLVKEKMFRLMQVSHPYVCRLVTLTLVMQVSHWDLCKLIVTILMLGLASHLGGGGHFMKLVIPDNLSFTDKYSDILDFDWLWSTVIDCCHGNSQWMTNYQWWQVSWNALHKGSMTNCFGDWNLDTDFVNKFSMQFQSCWQKIFKTESETWSPPHFYGPMVNWYIMIIVPEKICYTWNRIKSN